MSATSFPVEEATIEGIRSAMLAGELRCRTLVEAYLRRIEALDRGGPRGWAEQAFPNLIYFNQVCKGNHFAAWQEPDLFTAEVRAAFRALR